MEPLFAENFKDHGPEVVTRCLSSGIPDKAMLMITSFTQIFALADKERCMLVHVLVS